MLEHVFPHQVEANDIIKTSYGNEEVFMVETFTNETTIIRFKSGRKIICYSKEVLEVKKSIKSFSNCIVHKRDFKN